MPEPMLLRNFVAKVEWEGGVLQALDYGLHAEDLEETPESIPLREAWTALDIAYREHVQPALTRVETLLEELDEDGDRS